MAAGTSRWALCAAAALLSGTALAQGSAVNFPMKPVTLVIPFAPGGPVDIEGRRHAGKMTELMGQPFVLDYKPGAGETIGTTFVGRAPADGYTLLVGSASFTINPFLYKNLPYDVVRDFAPVSLVSQRASLLLAHASFPVKNVRELIAYAKANPGKINWGTTGIGSISHLSVAWLQSAAGIRVTVVHYKGAVPAQTDLIAGRTDMGSLTVLASLPMIKAGKVKALATLSNKRSRIVPDVATVEEQGVPGYNASSWFGILAPAATPAAVVGRLSEGFAKAVKSPEVATPLEADGISLVGSTPAQFRQTIGLEMERWRKVIQENGIRLEQ